MQVFGLVHFRLMENIFKWIDSFDLTTVNHYISWEREYPYNEVKCKAQYDDPFKHFTPEIAKIIKKAHSLNSDLHWIRNDRDWDRANESVSAQCEVLVAIFKRSHRFFNLLLSIADGISYPWCNMASRLQDLDPLAWQSRSSNKKTWERGGARSERRYLAFCCRLVSCPLIRYRK